MNSLTIKASTMLPRIFPGIMANRATIGPSKKKRAPGRLSVIFVTWNRTEHLTKTLDSFYNHVSKIEPLSDMETISVDNNSENEDVLQILSRYKWDHAIRNRSNLGISKALDQAYSASTGEFVVCLEDDWETVATKPFWNRCFEILRMHDDLGGIRLKESVQCYVSKKTAINHKQVVLEFDDEAMRRDGVPWRGKFKNRNWYDVRGKNGDFYTWTSYGTMFPNTYANSCFLFKGEAYDHLGTFSDKSEHIYSINFGRYYTAGVLTGERRFVHLGQRPSKARPGGWHE